MTSSFRRPRKRPASYQRLVTSPASSRLPSPKASPAASATAPRISVNAAVTISSETPTCCSAMNTAIRITTLLASFATIGTPDTVPADARIRARTNSPVIRPRITITIAAMSVGRNPRMRPNISLMLSSPSAALASRITTSITSQKMRFAAARTGSSREPVRVTTSSSPRSCARRLKSTCLRVRSAQR